MRTPSAASEENEEIVVEGAASGPALRGRRAAHKPVARKPVVHKLAGRRLAGRRLADHRVPPNQSGPLRRNRELWNVRSSTGHK
jgi:hypothetical protein